MKISINQELIIPEAIFIDLDGTLLDLPKHQISNANKEAIIKTSQESLIVISTGRTYSYTVKKLISTLNLEYAICQNGSLIVDKNGKKILEILIDKDLVKKVIDFAIKHNLVVLVNSEFKLYNRRRVLFFLRLFNRKKFVSFRKFDFNQDVRKIVLAGSFRNKIFKYFNLIKEEIPELSYSISGNDYIIEITHHSANKGKAAQFLCDVLTIDAKKSIHIGDSLNDSTTLDYLGALIAMKGASNHLKKIATHIGTTNNRRGVAAILNGHFKKNEFNI